MFGIIGSVAKGIVKGVRDILPIAQVGDAVKDLKIERVLEAGELAKADSNNQSIQKAVYEFLDILDDGKKNHSSSKKKAETIARVLTGLFPLVAWLLHGISTGNWLIF